MWRRDRRAGNASSDHDDGHLVSAALASGKEREAAVAGDEA
jgi:hypothetical protein